MREVGIAGGIIAILALTGALAVLPYLDLLTAGAWMVAFGFGVGVPAGVVYHIQLFRTLSPRGELPAGWIWRPISLNRRLRPYDRMRVLSWCYIGAGAFFFLGIGLVVFVMGLSVGLARGL